ncbi:GHKL domain-containing protein [Deinococcus sp. KSM4-11]|uniref:sensor histidine kinase n=1 Tax=Deinococcus sp. KSM4-11 TaxID=2568654 RepID=UPI0010A48CE4|nr:ATP-binding protein [Deinococcus sp. KSM4-11]THF84343.1 GHKL domain-containing protein [Deinococcus sp. KSM4-11]
MPERPVPPALAQQVQDLTERLNRALADHERLLVQQQEAEIRSRALEAFATLARDLTLEQAPLPLIGRAQDILVDLMPDAICTYYEVSRGTWWLRSHRGTFRDPALLRGLASGLPRGATINLDRPFDQRQGFYQNVYDPSTTAAVQAARIIRASAAFPVEVSGRVTGVLVVGRHDAYTWTTVDRTLLDTIVTSLSLALERAVQTRELADEREGLLAFAAFTDAVGVQTDVLALARQATEVVRTQLGTVSVAYYELEDDLWKARVWSKDITPDVAAEISAGISQEAPDFRRALLTPDGLFVNGWDAQANRVDTTEKYGAVAFFPLFVSGEACSLLVTGTQEAHDWTDRDRAVIRAVGRSLALALERASQTRQLQLQRDTLDARTASLTAANEELEAFTYSASHDLRTPIRHVTGFADLARRSLRRQQNEQVERHLDIIQQGAQRMESLIEGMLTLSRAGREGFRPVSVDLGPIVKQAREDAALEFPAHPVEWHVDATSVVWADPVLLQQVMTNLLSNAVKYSSTRESSVVRLHMQETDIEWIIAVRDNGVGFDSRYAGKLFGIFQRLHSQQTFQGTGVGLATVRRIVLKHGGRVFAHTHEEGGATFGFTLPKALAI